MKLLRALLRLVAVVCWRKALLRARARGSVLIPHPGPLPVEGRGRAPDLRDGRTSADRLRTARIFQTFEADPPPPSGSPSPLNGERAGVRGEPDLSCSLAMMPPYLRNVATG